MALQFRDPVILDWEEEREDETPWEMPAFLEACQQADPPPREPRPGEGSKDLGQMSTKPEEPRVVGVRPAPCSALRTPGLLGTFLGGSPPISSFTSSSVFAGHPPQLQLYLPRNPPSVALPPCTGLETVTRLVPKDSALPLTALEGPTRSSQGLMKERMPKAQGASPIPRNPTAQGPDPGSPGHQPFSAPRQRLLASLPTPAALSPQAKHPGVLGRMGGNW